MIASIKGTVTLLLWAVAANVAATVAVFGMLFTLSGRLGEISGQLAQIARVVR